MTGASLGYSGHYGDSLTSVGTGGYWWESTIRDASNSYSLSVRDSGTINPNNFNSKSIGRAVR
ncbi:hypothetical protein IKE88_00015 [Candidatus Saccharibacteria bacterium]|nr:hypothetical protein [Candidatus Saccharibacteria bacterium]